MWKPMEDYMKLCDFDSGAETWWGPEVLVLISTAHGPVRLVAHLEADMWLSRAAEDHTCWSELETAPTYWCEIPNIISDIHSDPKKALT